LPPPPLTPLPNPNPHRTQIRFEKAYVDAFTPEERGTVVAPRFGEWLQGLPDGYTDFGAKSVAPLDSPPPEAPLLRTLDLFSGVGGLTLGIRRYARPLAYCEADATIRLILQARMDSGHLHHATIFDDVATLTEARLRADPGVAAELPSPAAPLNSAIDMVVAGPVVATPPLFPPFAFLLTVGETKQVSLPGSIEMRNASWLRRCEELAVSSSRRYH